MYRVELISMPFAATDRPSFALTQIQSILKIKYPELFDVHIRYINHDFAEYIGLEQYNTALDGTNIHTGLEMDGTTTGIKEWMFRQIVFLDSADNKEEFLEFLSYVSKPVKNYVLELRTRIDAWLISVIEKLDLATADMLAFTCVFDQRLPSFAMARKSNKSIPKS